MSDSMTVQLRLVEGSSSQFRIELSPPSIASSYVMREPRIGWMSATRFVGGVR